MSLVTKITAGFQAAGAALKSTNANIGSLASLTTTAKSSLVAAINEVKAGGGSSNPTITYTGSAWPARSTVTVPSGGYAIYDSTAYPGAPQPSDYVDGDVWNPAGLLMPALAGKAIAWWQAFNATTGLQGIGITIAAVGTATAASMVTAATATAQTRRKRLEMLVTAAATSAVAGFREASNAWQIANGFRFNMVAGMATGTAAGTSRRFFMGLTSVNTAATDANPSAVADALGLGADSGDTNLQIMYRTGSGTVVKVDTGFVKNVSDRTEMYRLDMTALAGGTTVSFTITRLSDGSVFNHTSTTAIPAANTLLAVRGMASVGGVSSVIGFALASLYIEADI